jgi:uncharacterized protein (DUF934 family)
MARIIKGRRIDEDNWRLLEAEVQALLAPGEDGFIPELPAGDIVVPLKLWRLRGDELIERPGRLGVWLAAHDGPEEIASDLAHFELLAVRFEKFSDGRGYSLARLLRERYGWRGELRAFGDIGRDQLLFLERVGFDAFELRAGADPRAALAAFAELPETHAAYRRRRAA